jgi:hypothetical protein
MLSLTAQILTRAARSAAAHALICGIREIRGVFVHNPTVDLKLTGWFLHANHAGSGDNDT